MLQQSTNKGEGLLPLGFFGIITDKSETQHLTGGILGTQPIVLWAVVIISHQADFGQSEFYLTEEIS